MPETSEYPELARRTHPLRDRRIFCWALYDWANSAYSTLVITVLVAYIQRVVYPEESWGTTGAVVYAWGISLSMLLGALLSPLVGAMADAQQNKRGWLAVTAFSGAAASVAMGLVPTENYVLISVLFVVANLMFELTLGFYNGFLPEIAREDQLNAASGWGFGLGYIGGGLALVIAMLIIQFGESLGLASMASRLQASLVLMGLWWGGFTIPTIWVLRDARGEDYAAVTSSDAAAADAGTAQRTKGYLAEVWQTIKDLRFRPSLMWFLIAFLFYNDGIQTVISQASTFALQELDFAESGLMGVILMIQFLAMPGALLVSRLADKFGKKPMVLVCLGIWIGVLVIALWVDSQLSFWLLAVVIAMVMGGTQSVSRALMAELIPTNQNAQYFGFFNLSGKATSFMGTFLFGAIVYFTDSSRLAIFGLLPLFVAGALCLLLVKAPRSNSTGASKAPVEQGV